LRRVLSPRSLAGRTIFILLIGFAFVQILGLMIETSNQMQLERIEEESVLATRAVIIYRHVALAAPKDRAATVAKEAIPGGDVLSLSVGLSVYPGAFQLPLAAQQIIRGSIITYGSPFSIHPRGLKLLGLNNPPRDIISFAMPDGQVFGFNDGERPRLPPSGLTPLPRTWLTVTSRLSPPVPWRSPDFATAFIVMAVLGSVMIVWAVCRLLAPVRTLAAAAERLGRDVVNAQPLPKSGPSEIVIAAVAFNTMAARIRRFVDDRTFLITAIGHDLRTPITRLKLRAEYMDDDEQRRKMLADLDEMEAMVAATLAFGRDITTTEAIARIDLSNLLRTILDECADGVPELAPALSFSGPDHLTVRVRPLGLKRALTNLVGNAMKYGDAARILLHHPKESVVQIDIDDCGPGIDSDKMEEVFKPFRRLEASRNRETGGSGLGLSIARNVIRAHGGKILLQNLPKGGLRASVRLPV
jgi:hypothetical protein